METISNAFAVTAVRDGEKGADGVTYEVESTVGTLIIPSGSTSVPLATTLRFWRRKGTAARAAYSCHSWLFVRKGTAYTLIPGYGNQTSKATTRTVNITSTVASTYITASYDAVVVFINSDAAAFDTNNYLAKLEIPIVKHGEKGQKGDNGDDAVDYSLLPSSAQFVYDPGTDVITPQDFGLKVLRTEGSAPATLTWAQMTDYGLTLQYRDNGDSWSDVGQSNFNAMRNGTLNAFSWFVTDGIKTEDFQLLAGGVVVATATVSVTSNGEEGAQGPRGPQGPTGSTGPMMYLAGKYDAAVNYGALRTGTVCPAVAYEDSNGETYYWFPNDSYRGAGYAPSTANGWTQATSFDWVVTRVLFTQFAKLGGFVVSGDFMLSQYGELFDADGNSLALTQQTDADGSTHWRYNGVDAYTYFRDWDPMAELDPPYLPILRRNNWAYWSSYETTTASIYLTTNSSDENRAELIGLAVGGHYYLCGTDTGGNWHCLLMRKSSYNSSNARLYGYREEILNSHVPVPYSEPAYLFRPVKVVNAATGEEWLAGGKVHVGADGGVTVEGTIRAKNLYRNVCVFVDGGTYFNRNGERWFYNPTTKLYELSPESTSGKEQCVYDADIIIMLGRGASGWNTNEPVLLPRAEDFPGKMVEVIVKCDMSGGGTVYIGAVGGTRNSSTGNYTGPDVMRTVTSAVPTGDKYNLQSFQTANNCYPATPGKRTRWVSMPDTTGAYKWVLLDEL
jgi:hypothetical protein